jgi:ABC-type transport system involved in cytochrome bd biosynthesis fused ATPase/permease subunit
MFAIAAWAQGAGMVLAAVADNIRSSREAQAFLHLVSLPRQTFAGTRAVAAPNQIQARNLGFTYDQGPVVGAASFVAEKGAPLVLRGANGSGKSTILRLLAGLALPTSGELRVDGIGIQDLSMDEWRGHIVYLSQSPSFDPTSSVRDVLAAMLPGKTDASYLHALESVGFDSPTAMLDRPIGALSSGQRRRVHLARAIAADRPVMILDEPEAGLDAATEERVRGYLFEMAKTRLVILATHSSGYGPGVRLGVVGEGT